MTTRGCRVLFIRVLGFSFVDVLRIQSHTLDIGDLLRGVDWKGRQPFVLPILLQVEKKGIRQSNVIREIKPRRKKSGDLP